MPQEILHVPHQFIVIFLQLLVRLTLVENFPLDIKKKRILTIFEIQNRSRAIELRFFFNGQPGICIFKACSIKYLFIPIDKNRNVTYFRFELLFCSQGRQVLNPLIYIRATTKPMRTDYFERTRQCAGQSSVLISTAIITYNM